MSLVKKAMLASCLVVGASQALVPPASAEQESHQIVYRVYGEEGVTSADVSYRTPAGEAGAKTVSLPWSMSFQAPGDDERLSDELGLYVDRPESARGAGGLYVCEISVDGQVREKVERDLAEGSMQCFLGDDLDDEVDG